MTQLNANGDNLQLIVDAAESVFPDSELMTDLSIVQAILEGAVLHNPPSELALKYNNLFGIKGSGTEGTKTFPTHEFYNGEMHVINQQFAWNKDIEDSFRQHRLVLELPRYTKCWTCQTFEELAKEVQAAGYATDPGYSVELIRIFNEYFSD